MPDESGYGNKNNAQCKMDTILVSKIRLAFTLVSNCYALIVWVVWLLIKNLTHLQLIYIPTLLLILHAFVLLITKNIYGNRNNAIRLTVTLYPCVMLPW